MILRINVPERGHGYNCVPEGSRNGMELCVVHLLFAVVYDRGKYDDRHAHTEARFEFPFVSYI